MTNLHHPKLAKKLGISEEELACLRMPALPFTKELGDGSYEEPSFNTIHRIITDLRKKHGISHDTSLGDGLLEASVITKLEADWLEELRLEFYQLQTLEKVSGMTSGWVPGTEPKRVYLAPSPSRVEVDAESIESDEFAHNRVVRGFWQPRNKDDAGSTLYRLPAEYPVELARSLFTPGLTVYEFDTVLTRAVH